MWQWLPSSGGGSHDIYIHYNHECVPVRAYKKTIPACYQCGTIGHRVDYCPGRWKMRFLWPTGRHYASGLNEHECKPICMICGEAHLTGSAQCTGKFQKLRRPVSQSGGAKSSVSGRINHLATESWASSPATAFEDRQAWASKSPTKRRHTQKSTVRDRAEAASIQGRGLSPPLWAKGQQNR